MSKYGIDNVSDRWSHAAQSAARGGSYSELTLPDYKIKTLDAELSTVNNACFKCGKKGHYANNCQLIKDTTVKKVLYKKSTNVCYRCGRNSHYAERCYATTTIDGEDIIEDTESDESESDE